MKKSEIFILILIMFVLMCFYFSEIKSIFKITSEKRILFDLPRIERFSFSLPDKTSIGNFKVWDLKPLSQKQALRVGYNQKVQKKSKILLKINFKFKIVDGVPALVSALNDKYRWEFFGVVMTAEGKRAIFYNPFLKENGLKLVGVGEYLDDNLKLIRLSNNGATVEFNVDNESKKFVFSIFNVKNMNEKGGK